MKNIQNKAAVVILTVGFIFFCQDLLHAQKIWENRKGCARAQGNIAAGFYIPNQQFAGYVVGESEVFVDNKAGIGGEIWYHLPFIAEGSGFFKQHSLYAGMNYHFLKPKRFDPYIGLNPGVSIVNERFYNSSGRLETGNFKVIPAISVAAGFNYYLGSAFHFFFKVRYAHAQIQDEHYTTALDEFKITGGLGYNLRIIKLKQ